MFHSHSILKSTFPTLLPSPLKLKNFTTPNEPLISACVELAYVIKSIDYKLISVCLINDYLLIVDLHIFVYGRAE